MGRKIKHDYNTIYQRHINGESLKMISKDLGIHIQCIYSHFQRNGRKYNKEIVPRHEGYYVNDNYLDNIDTEDKAYFLGWMLSDGYINRNRLFLRLKSTDESIIKEMFSKFSYGFGMYDNKSKTSKAMSVSSNKMIDRLKELGCVENKTFVKFSIPDISDNLFRHFVRGYFDGDGSIGKRSARPNQMQVYVCSIDRTFLEQLQNKLLQFGIAANINEEIRKGKAMKLPDGKISYNCVNMYKLIIPSQKERLKFYEFLYKDCSIKLERKYVLYSEYYVNTVLILESKDSSTVQRIGDETLINYDLITDKTFYFGKEVDTNLILDLYKQGFVPYVIHKKTKIGRSVINRILKENITLPRVPDTLLSNDKGENIC